MASQMLEKILEAENQANDRLENTKIAAREMIEKAGADGKKILSEAKKAAEDERKAKLSALKDEQKKKTEVLLAEAQTECDKMSEYAASKSEECTRIILEKLMA